MKITKRQLRRIIRESWGDRPSWEDDASHPDSPDYSPHGDEAEYDRGYQDGFDGVPPASDATTDYDAGYEDGKIDGDSDAERRLGESVGTGGHQDLSIPEELAAAGLTPDEVAWLKSEWHADGAQGMYENEVVFDKLFNYYMDTGEMPYGVAKARTATPDEWIADRWFELERAGMGF